MNVEVIEAFVVALAVPVALFYLRRAGRRVVPHEPVVGMGEPWVQLRERGWFFRDFTVAIDGRTYRVVYDGGGSGERIVVDGQQVATVSGAAALVPRIEFPLAGHRGLIELDVRWLVVIKGARLSLDGVVLYREGTFAT